MKEEFEALVIEIHRINQAWHSYEISNRFLNVKNKFLEITYLKRKNLLQEKLMLEFKEKIEITNDEDTDNPGILIKDQYRFEYNGVFYKDACHKSKEHINGSF